MSNVMLRRQLLRMGRASAKAAEAGRIRFFALVAATAVAILAVAGFVLATASFDGRAERSMARWGQIVEPSSAKEAKLLWFPTIASSEDRQYDLVYLEPLVEDAPLPPGLAQWPEPGEAIVSPALKNAGRGEADKFGDVAGTISAEGLEAPGEYFAYVRPSVELLDAKAMIKVSGFGVELQEMPPVGEHSYNLSPDQFFWTYAALVGLPAALFVVIAARVGAAARDRRTAVLAALGASPGARRWFTVGEAALPVAFGTLAAAVAIAPVLAIDVPMPLVDFVLFAPDARAAAVQLAAVVAGVPLAVLVALLLLQPPYKSGGSTRPVSSRRRREWMLWLFPVALFATVRGADLAPYDLRLPALAAGSVVTLALLPGVVGAIVAAAGPAMAKAAAGRGSAGLLVAGRRLAGGSRSVTRLVAALVIAIGLAAQGQVTISLFTEMSQKAQTLANHLGTSVLQVSPTIPTPPSAPRMAAFQRQLDTDISVLTMWSLPEQGRIDVVAECPVWQRLNVACTSSLTEIQTVGHSGLARTMALQRTSGTRFFARAGEAEKTMQGASGPSYLVLAGDGGKLSTARIHRAANTELAMSTQVKVFGMDGMGVAGEALVAERWLALLSLIGVSVVAIVACIGAMAQFVRSGRELGPVSVLAGNQRVYYSVAAWSLLGPAIIAVVASVLVSWFITSPLPASGANRLAALTAVGGAGLVCTVVMAWWGARAAASAAAAWRPSGE